MEELFRLSFMTHRINHEEKVVKGKIFTVISMLFKDDCQSFDSKNSFQDVEVLTEKKVSLHDNFFRSYVIERCMLFDRSIVRFRIEIKYLPQTFLDLFFAKNN